MKTTKNQLLLIILVCITAFFLIYSPHLSNPFPLHIDEYHHISSSINLKQNNLTPNLSNTEIGFHFVLLTISYLTNLILSYKYLAAIYIILTILTLFTITKQETKQFKESFLISIFTIIFLISIKSNVNLLGFWFFTPLTLAIPLIYLYIHLFTSGINHQNKKHLIYSLLIMLLLLPIHAISILFSLPILLIYLIIKRNKINPLKKNLSLFLAIPLVGIIIFKLTTQFPTNQLLQKLFSLILFKKGWGVLELNNSPFELYSPIAYILAIIGLLAILSNKKYRENLLIHVIWPLTLILSIIIFKLTNISFLSPYQRNLFYLVISLPFLSAFGLYQIIKHLKKLSKNPTTHKILKILLIILVIFLTFKSYYLIPEQTQLYKTINQSDYKALTFLTQYPSSTILTPIQISMAVFPISSHNPLATYYFYGNRQDLEQFYQTTNCNTKNQIITKHNISFIYSKSKIDCDWGEIYNKNKNIIYKTNQPTPSPQPHSLPTPP